MFGSRANGNYRPVNLGEFSDDSSDEGDDFIQRSVKAQQEQLKRQDEGLEMLSQSAERLGQLSMNISEQLGYQNQMLDDLETGLDEASDNLDIVTRKTKEMIQKAGGTRNCILIVILTLVALVLFFLVIYT